MQNDVIPLPSNIDVNVQPSTVLAFLQDPIVSLFVFLGLFVLAIIIMIFVLRKIIRSQKSGFSSFKNIIYLVQMPKQLYEGEKKQPETLQQIQEKIAVMDNFFSSLGGLKAQKGFKSWFLGRDDHFAFEIVLKDDYISFYLVAPDYMGSFIQEQLHAQFPSAHIEESPDYNIFSPTGIIKGAYMTFKRPSYFPIKTFKKIESDPLNAITNPLSKMDKGTGAAIQYIVRSAPGSWHDMGSKVASEMQQGKNLNDATKAAKGGFWKFLADFRKSTSHAKEDPAQASSQPKEYRMSPLEQEMIKGLEEKTSKAGMDVNIRIVVSADTEEKAKSYLDNLTNSFNQYNIYQYGNGLENSGGKLSKLVNDFIFRNFEEKKQILLNTEEMASVFHFPLPSTETPKINWLLFKRAPAPLNMPTEGILLGKNIYRGQETEVRMKRKDRQRHMYIIGQTGTGKSYFMQNLIIQDIKNGEGLCFIDPHGDGVDAILQYIPKERAEDVILFDPSDTERPMGLNMLEFQNPEQKGFVINEMIAIFDKLYDLKATGGPIFEQYMRNAMLLIMDDVESGSTLMEISKVLANEEFRKYKLSKTTNTTVRDFWIKEAEKAGGEAALANMVPYITSKLTQFVSNDIMRPIIAQQKSAFNFRDVMDNKKILLMNMSKGKIGDMNSNLLGMVIIGKLLMAALSRTDIPEDQREDFYLYIDEFQNYITDTIAIILSEARKYKLDMVIAHQFLGQLVKNNDTKVKDAVFGNVGTTVSFRIGIEDAETMAKQFAPVFSDFDVVNVANSNAYIKMLVDNANPPPFNLFIPSREKGNPKMAEAIKELSRLKFGRDRELIEAEIMERVNKQVAVEEEEEE